MPLWERSRKSCIAVLGVTALLFAGAAAPASAAAAEVEQVVNGGFDGTSDPFWSTAGMPIALTDGRACVDVPGGTANRWDAAIGQNDIDLVAGESYRFSFDASGDAGHIVQPRPALDDDAQRVGAIGVLDRLQGAIEHFLALVNHEYEVAHLLGDGHVVR